MADDRLAQVRPLLDEAVAARRILGLPSEDWLEKTLAAIGRAIDKVNKPIAQRTTCQRCGRRDGLDAQVTDEEWAIISGRTDGGGILCLWCMDELAAEKGLNVPVPISAVLHFAGEAIFAESHTIWDEEQLPTPGRGRHDEASAHSDPR